MFGLYQNTSNKEIELFVFSAMSDFKRTEKILPSIENIIEFSSQKSLGRWKRSRISVEVRCWANKAGLPMEMGKACAAAVDMFVLRYVSLGSIHANAYECGLAGAFQLIMSGDERAAAYAGVSVFDEYIFDPSVREYILFSYKHGWLALNNKELADHYAGHFKSIVASVAHGPCKLDQESLEAWRRGEITSRAVERYRVEREKEDNELRAQV